VANKFSLRVISPVRVVFEGDVDAVYAPAIQGEFGVLPGHAPYLAQLKIGEIRILQNNKWLHVAVSGGVSEVDYTSMKILADAAELCNEIDVGRATRARSRAEEALKAKDKLEEQDIVLTTAALDRALNRLRIAEKGGDAD
jgi:F-type H+-transporting ATPase subunit epsilon